jgi:hypothetical protein
MPALEEKKFKNDYRQSNPGLHLLYVKWAVAHLAAADRMIRELYGFANLNAREMGVALEDAYARLVATDAAYADADEIVRSVYQRGVLG